MFPDGRWTPRGRLKASRRPGEPAQGLKVGGSQLLPATQKIPVPFCHPLFPLLILFVLSRAGWEKCEGNVVLLPRLGPWSEKGGLCIFYSWEWARGKCLEPDLWIKVLSKLKLPLSFFPQELNCTVKNSKSSFFVLVALLIKCWPGADPWQKCRHSSSGCGWRLLQQEVSLNTLDAHTCTSYQEYSLCKSQEVRSRTVLWILRVSSGVLPSCVCNPTWFARACHCKVRDICAVDFVLF